LQKHIELMEGDSLIVYAVSREPPPPITPEPVQDLNVLLQIGGVNIYVNEDKSYMCFKSDLDVCTDGTGDHHGDKTPLNQTAYYNNGKYLNADIDRYVVIPPQVRSMVPGVVMGCKARATNLDTDVSSEAVTGDIGPTTKTGECAICLAQILNPKVTANAGDSRQIYFYELWPGVPANVNGKLYKLEPAT
jgi:hypothetical protein